MERITFRGELQQARGGGAFIPLPAEVVERLGSARVRVVGSVGGVAFTSSTMPTGGGGAVLGVHKATRERAGIEFGDVVEVRVERDDRERTIDVPPALAAALEKDPTAQAAFDALAFTHRREYAQWVADAKREETVQRRVAETLERLREGSRE